MRIISGPIAGITINKDKNGLKPVRWIIRQTGMTVNTIPIINGIKPPMFILPPVFLFITAG
jgi:hypothetical protein